MLSLSNSKAVGPHSPSVGGSHILASEALDAPNSQPSIPSPFPSSYDSGSLHSWPFSLEASRSYNRMSQFKGSHFPISHNSGSLDSSPRGPKVGSPCNGVFLSLPEGDLNVLDANRCSPEATHSSDDHVAPTLRLPSISSLIAEISPWEPRYDPAAAGFPGWNINYDDVFWPSQFSDVPNSQPSTLWSSPSSHNFSCLHSSPFSPEVGPPYNGVSRFEGDPYVSDGKP